MKVDAREILFIRENEPRAFSRLICESLASKGITVNRTVVHKETRTLKDEYNEVILTEARRLLKAIKGVEYKSDLVA